MHQYRGFLFRCFVQESGADPFVVFDESVDFLTKASNFIFGQMLVLGCAVSQIVS